MFRVGKKYLRWCVPVTAVVLASFLFSKRVYADPPGQVADEPAPAQHQNSEELSSRVGASTARRLVELQQHEASRRAGARPADEEGAQARELGGWITLAAGAAVLLGGGTWWLLNESAVDDAETRQDAAALALATGQPCGSSADATSPDFVACDTELDAATADLERHESLRTVSLLVTGVGVAATTIGAVLLLTAADSTHYDGAGERSPDPFPPPWQLSGQVGLDGGSVQLRHRF